ncbi:MAG: isoleucine--tRNA ligase [Cytophagales bacterium]|jgi:isoleucyl-tRNA synthetase|tara:strand:+ start:62678 stop:66046 length:3369 start_codon:yes stop_codon:yes gene_type:complete
MVKFREYKQINYPEVGKEIRAFWENNNIFSKTITERSGGPSFTFFEGPPSANGTPGIHHVMARAVKDIFCRYKTQKGFQVKRKGGWDTHGLPVELQVEKELGITKEDIGKKISVADYNKKCKEAVMKFKGEWDELTRQIGYWVDLESPYMTFDVHYMESVWHLLKKLFEKDLLYKGYTVQPFSPAAGTGLSSHELNQPGTYQDIKDTSVVAQFKVKPTQQSAFLFDQEEEDVRILAWTTTPWTLPSNCALAVGDKIHYVKISTFNPYTYQPVSVILAKELINKYFTEKANQIALSDYQAGDKLIPWKLLNSFTGKDLLEIRYEQLMPYVTNDKLNENGFRVISGDFVSTEDGTGVVHTASVFGADDFRISQQNNVPAVMVLDDQGLEVPLVDRKGCFVTEVIDFAGKYVREEYYPDAVRQDPNFKSTDVLIAIKLKEENLAFKVEKYEHSYPHCWRTDKPILYYPLDSWFIKTTALKDRLVALNNTINWKPKSTGAGRFGNWLENLVDWNLSRSRYWGTPLPIWVTVDKSEKKCIGSIAELRTEVDQAVATGLMSESLPENFDLHRPFVDDVILVSPTGQPMHREPDLIDVWFDSGAMPYAQWHYPFENQDLFNSNYPADFIAEGVDQTRGWFFTLHAISSLLFDTVAFKNVIANGLVLDKNGNKMSKRLGNAVNPFDVIEQYGPDATRWYMISNANPWDNLKFDANGILDVQRKFFGTLSNTYSFFALYANLDAFNFKNKAIAATDKTESDLWIISRLNSVVREVDQYYDDYEPTKAVRAIQSFTVNDLSNWYIRLNRKRFWIGDYNQNKEVAYQTLYTCLHTIAQLMAPVAPFYAEKLFLDLNSVTKLSPDDSVHLAHFPVVNEEAIDPELEARMRLAQLASSLVHSLRKKQKIKVRQPLSKILIPVLNKDEKNKLKKVEELIINETNVKTIDYLDDDTGILIKKIKPNFRTLGVKFGAQLKVITPKINSLIQTDIAQFESDGFFNIEIEGEMIELQLTDVEISSQDIPGWLVASEDGLTVALDINLTDVLKKEGLSRDIVNRIQNLRKDQNLEVQDKIDILYSTHDKLIKEAMEVHQQSIQQETQAKTILFNADLPNGISLDIDGAEIIIQLKVISYEK